MSKRLNADLDDDHEALLEACVEDSEYDYETEYVRYLIRKDAERRGINADDAPDVDAEDEDPPISETYDPDAERDEVLTTDELRELSGAVRKINPDHVDHIQERVPNGEAVAVVEAAARYSFNFIHRDDVQELCEKMGLVTDYYLTDNSNGVNVPGVVSLRFGDERATKPMGFDDGGRVKIDVDAGEVAATSAAMALLRVDIDGRANVGERVEEQYDRWNMFKDNLVKHFRTRFAQDVIRGALYQLSGTNHRPVLKASTYDDEELEAVDWPRDPEGLVEWYVGEEDPDWASKDKLKSEVVKDIGYHVAGWESAEEDAE